jgi:hypothetical protein
MANKHSVWQERLRYEDKAATKFLNPNRLTNIEFLLKSLQRYVARLKTRPTHPSRLKSSSTSELICSQFNRTSASPGGSRGKYSGSMQTFTTGAPGQSHLRNAYNPALANGAYSPSPQTRPSTAELARKSMIKCASLSDGFQRAVNLIPVDDPLQRRFALESRPSTSIGLRKNQAYKSSPYLQKLPQKKQRRHRLEVL